MKLHLSKIPVLNANAVLGLVLLLSVAASPAAFSMELAGVVYQPVATSGGAALKLNGAGVWKVAGKDLYAAALYLDRPMGSSDAVIQSRAPKQLRVVALSDVSANEFVGLLAQGLVANSSEAQLSGLTPALFGLGELFGEQQKLRTGDTVQIDWAEASGTTVSIFEKGATAARRTQLFGQAGLFTGMLRLWLGDQPADARLKSALLGQKA